MITDACSTPNSYSRGDPDHRAPAQAEHDRLIRQRAIPALFVVDASLRVLHYRQDPGERRRDCTMDAGSQTLPPLIERTARALLDQRETSDGVLSAAPNASIVVRLMPLDGSPKPLFAVLVERLKMRATLRAVGERYALSQREREALALVVEGARNHEIAARLQIAPSTAIFHVKRLMAKTGTRNRTELVAKVIG